MKRSTRTAVTVLLVVLGLTLIALGASWFLRNFQRVEHTLHLPPTGEAAYNPLYALRRAIEIDGVRVQSRQRLALDTHPLEPRDTLVLYNDARWLSRVQIDTLLDWVEAGGHLIVRTPPSSMWEETESPLLAEIGVTPSGQSSCADFQVADEPPHTEFCRGQRFRMHDVEPELAWGDLDAGYAFARIAHGKGHVDVLADLSAFANRGENALMQMDEPPSGGLRDITHAVLARQVLAPNYGAGTIHLIYAAETPSLLRTLVTRGWMVWVPLLLALAGWLWSRMQRFGPMQPAPVMERRSLLEHVRASGDHLFRYGRGVLLYVAVRQAFLIRLRRRDPVAAALTGDAQIEIIATRMNVPADTVRKALQVPASHDRTAFRDRISTLIELRNRL